MMWPQVFARSRPNHPSRGEEFGGTVRAWGEGAWKLLSPPPILSPWGGGAGRRVEEQPPSPAAATAKSLSFILVSPTPGDLQLPTPGPKAEGSMEEGARVWVQPRTPDSAHLPPSLPRQAARPPSRRHPPRRQTPAAATSRPRCPVRVPGRRSQVGVARLCPSHGQGARGGPRPRAPLLGPTRRLPAYTAPSVPQSPARKGCPPRPSPNSPRN